MSAAGDPIVVAVDGPAGSGKSSVSKAASRALGYAYLDTGAAYRALTWVALESGIDADDEADVVALLEDFPYSTEVGAEDTIVKVGDVDVTDEIREPRVSAAVSGIARIPEVRSALNDAFRRLIARTSAPGIVVEGRDITTVVAPDAPVRILLTADEETRIRRRTAELDRDETQTAAQIVDRDRRDLEVNDFMTAAPGVITIDSTELSYDETVDAVVETVRAHLRAS